MRAAGVALVVAGVLVFANMAILHGPPPEWLCGRAPAALVAAVGYQEGGDLATNEACQRSARWETVKAAVVGAVIASAGLGLVIAAGDRERHKPPPAQPATLYGLRSPDGAWWWNGRSWQPVPPNQRP